MIKFLKDYRKQLKIFNSPQSCNERNLIRNNFHIQKRYYLPNYRPVATKPFNCVGKQVI